jgi:L-cysteate sulfo-lyase
MLEEFPRISLGHFPTPLEHLPRLTEHAGGPDIWIKRDDCTGLALGGNKTRKLEFALADALAKRADTIVTAGAEQSNHVRQTAAAAAKLGLRCIVVFEHVFPTPSKIYRESGNVLLDRIFGAELHECPTGHTVDEALQALAADVTSQGRRPYVIPVGCSSPVGALGYVDAAGEVLEQADGLGIHIDHLVTATGSAGTQAGLLVGFRAAGRDVPVLGIGVSAPQPVQEEKVYKLACETAALIGRPGLVSRKDILVNCGYVGDGYGLPTKAMNEALLLAARLEGLLVDPVYSGKALAGTLDLLRRGEFADAENIVFLHTGGGAALFAYADQLRL